eukprot:Nk52_evm5s2273 gene=Nk52_evmTU5s2273
MGRPKGAKNKIGHNAGGRRRGKAYEAQKEQERLAREEQYRQQALLREAMRQSAVNTETPPPSRHQETRQDLPPVDYLGDSFGAVFDGEDEYKDDDLETENFGVDIFDDALTGTSSFQKPERRKTICRIRRRMRDLKDAIFSLNKDDYEKVENFLKKSGESISQYLKDKKKSDWLWKVIRRYVLPPKQLEDNINNLTL